MPTTVSERYHQNARRSGQPWDQERTNPDSCPPDRPTSRDSMKVLSNFDWERFIETKQRRTPRRDE